MRSVARGNGLLTVYIDGVCCMNNGYSLRGPNPLNYIGLEFRPDGKAGIWENFSGEWRPYPLFKLPARWPAWLPKPGVGWIQPLSAGAAAYDYARDKGYENLSEWSQLAAIRAGK